MDDDSVLSISISLLAGAGLITVSIIFPHIAIFTAPAGAALISGALVHGHHSRPAEEEEVQLLPNNHISLSTPATPQTSPARHGKREEFLVAYNIVRSTGIEELNEFNERRVSIDRDSCPTRKSITCSGHL